MVSDQAYARSTVGVEEIREPTVFPSKGSEHAAGPRIIARSKRMGDLLALAGRIAASDLSVLILGESGVGKELLAESIHLRSIRSGRPFLQLNCATLGESLFESELFGHEAGAFTGASRRKPGLLELSDKGTVLLDEVAELPPSVQAKLLRVVEVGQFLRVGFGAHRN